MKIAFGSDHAGFDLKKLLAEHAENLGHEIIDVGTNSTERCDYPDFGKKAAEAVMSGEVDRAVVVCGTGIGISMAANKVPGFRCAPCTNEIMARLARNHNNAQGLAVGSRIIGTELAKAILEVFLSEGFDGGRHAKRVEKIG